MCPSFGSIVSSSQTPQRADFLRSILAFCRRFPCVVVIFRMRARSSVFSVDDFRVRVNDNGVKDRNRVIDDDRND